MMRVTLDELLQVWDVLSRYNQDCLGPLQDDRGAYLAFHMRAHLEFLIQDWERVEMQQGPVN